MEGLYLVSMELLFAKREYLKHQLGEEQMGLMSGIKSVFDPKGILNPGKIV